MGCSSARRAPERLSGPFLAVVWVEVEVEKSLASSRVSGVSTVSVRKGAGRECLCTGPDGRLVRRAFKL